MVQSQEKCAGATWVGRVVGTRPAARKIPSVIRPAADITAQKTANMRSVSRTP